MADRLYRALAPAIRCSVYRCRHPAARNAGHLMLLGSPPDMVHGALPRRTRTCIPNSAPCSVRKERMFSPVKSAVYHFECYYKLFLSELQEPRGKKAHCPGGACCYQSTTGLCRVKRLICPPSAGVLRNTRVWSFSQCKGVPVATFGNSSRFMRYPASAHSSLSR